MHAATKLFMLFWSPLIAVYAGRSAGEGLHFQAFLKTINTMQVMLWVLLAAALFIVGSQLWMVYRLAILRRAGAYPQPGNATMADVERLLQNGKRGLAMRCYREVHPCSLRQASDALDHISAPH